MSQSQSDTVNTSTVTTSGVRLYLFRVQNKSNDPDLIIPREDVQQVRISERVQGTKDSAKFSVVSEHGEYANAFEPGDRLEFWVRFGAPRPYGSHEYGSGTYGGGYQKRWTGLVRGLTYDRDGPAKTEITVDCEDFVHGIMNMRVVYNAFEETPIAGSPDAILNQLLAEYAPEIDRSRIREVEQTTDIFASGIRLFDVALDLTRRADGVMAKRDRALEFYPVHEIDSQFEIQPGVDTTTHSVRVHDDDLVNDLRVDGGEDHAIDQSQETVEAYERVTDNDRLLVPLQARKSRFDRIELWTRRNPDTEDGLVIRLQNDRDGAPVNPDSTQSDIANHQLPHHFLSLDDYTTFLIPEHTLPPGDQVWMLIESSGQTGHDIGVRLSDGRAAFKAHYPFAVNVQIDDIESAGRYRRRQERVKRENISTFQAARDYGESYVRANNEPRRELQFRARSLRCRRLATAEAITANMPHETAVGDYIITERTDTYVENTLTSVFTAQEAATV